jgi:hypothetical protein
MSRIETWKIALSCLLLTVCLAVSAKAGSIENLVFTGTATCEGSTCSSIGSGPVTGTYSFDITTQTIVGAWSFSTPFGVVSSSASGGGSFQEGRDGDNGSVFYDATSTPPFYDFLWLFFPGSDTEQLGALATNLDSEGCQTLSGEEACYPDYKVTGATALATPEPSSWMLLGIGMLVGLVGLQRHLLSSLRRRHTAT